ncbi:MAG: hypothetical protein LAT67_02660 [Balneolales bacterium]|nr:hypothetical protein [Balneolales bacterium]
MIDIDYAVKATRYGAYAAFFSAAVTIGVVTFSIVSNPDGRLGYFNDPWNYIDVPILAALGIGMLYKSRVAAAVALINHLASQVILRVELQDFWSQGSLGFGVAVLFLGFYSNAFFGAVVYHKIKAKQDPEYVAATIKSKVFGTIASVLVLGLIVLSLIDVFSTPENHPVFTADEVQESEYYDLLTTGIVSGHEEMLYFYPYNTADILMGGSIVTNERLVVYLRQEDAETLTYSLELSEIERVELKTENFVPFVNKYMVYGETEDRWLQVFLSTNLDRHELFISKLQKDEGL